MSDESKVCTKCQQERPLSEFALRGAGRQGRHSWCKPCVATWTREYSRRHPEKRAAYYAANKDTRQAYNRAYQVEHRDRLSAVKAAKRRERRETVLAAYGGVCACCGESEYAFLTIDHVDNDGAQHRKLVSSARFLYWVIRSGFPPGFQVLCWNCNAAKEFNGGCPHQRHLQPA